MDQPEEVLEKLERFNVQKNPEITRELDEYVSFVARTGESVFNWALVKRLYREKLINVITEFNEASAKELPVYPNVDPFNYETMKKMLIERLDSFNAAPFTIQRISELLADPRKQYSRIDKFMRAVEKNILVVSTVSPGRTRSEESENGDSLDSVGLNGDFSSDVNVDIDMENDNDGSFTMTKEFNATTHRKEGNNDIVSVTQETVMIKKVSTKEEESSIQTVAVNVNTGELLQPTKTDITVDSQSSVTITVCEPSSQDISATVLSEETEQNKSSFEKNESSEQKSNDANKNDGLIKSAEPIASIIEPKVDEDALLNEPLRPADDEILVNTESSQTTPLAALENIVANRTVIEETPRIEDQQQEQKAEQIIVQSNLIEQEEQIEKPVIDESAADANKDAALDDSETAAKRLKIEIVAEDKPVTDENLKEKENIANIEISEVFDQNAENKIEEPLNENSASTLITAIVEEPSEEKSQVQAQDELLVPNEAEDASQGSIIITPLVEIEAIQPEIITEIAATDPTNAAIEDEVIEQQEQQIVLPVVENQREDEMEAVPIVENPMALDEDVCTAVEPSISADMDVNVAPIITSKMDTDNENDNGLMDVDDDEPMDQ